MKLNSAQRRRVREMLVELERIELTLHALLTVVKGLRRPSAPSRKLTRRSRCQ